MSLQDKIKQIKQDYGLGKISGVNCILKLEEAIKESVQELEEELKKNCLVFPQVIKKVFGEKNT